MLNPSSSQDWNGDGVLSGDEVVAGARRPAWNQDWNRDGRVDALDNQIAQRYRSYDANGDNRVARTEWPGDARLFAQLDANRDGYVTIAEYTNGAGFNRDGQGGPAFRFSNIDLNGDGWLTRNEWNLGSRILGSMPTATTASAASNSTTTPRRAPAPVTLLRCSTRTGTAGLPGRSRACRARSSGVST